MPSRRHPERIPKEIAMKNTLLVCFYNKFSISLDFLIGNQYCRTMFFCIFAEENLNNNF